MIFCRALAKLNFSLHSERKSMVNQKAFMNRLLEHRTRMEICSSKGVVGDVEMAECLPGACFFSHSLPSVSLTLFHLRYRVP